MAMIAWLISVRVFQRKEALKWRVVPIDKATTFLRIIEELVSETKQQAATVNLQSASSGFALAIPETALLSCGLLPVFHLPFQERPC